MTLIRSAYHIFTKIFIFFFTITGLGVSLILISWLFYKNVAQWYLHLPEPIGGDYYVGLSYATFFSKHLPWPPSGWFPLWNSGVPVVGGYPWFIFYQMAPLLKTLNPGVAMDIYSLVTLLLFFVFAHLLYFTISRSHFLSVGLTLISVTSLAPFYQLMSGGFIISSAMQFYLPLSLTFTFLYIYKNSIRFLALAAVCSGLAVLSHSAMGMFFVVLPNTVLLFTVTVIKMRRELGKRFWHLSIFFFFIVTLGSMGIFPYAPVASDRCNNPQCWGIYPDHLRLWLGYMPILVTVGFIVLYSIFIVVRKLQHKSTGFTDLLPVFMATLVVLAYPVAAYLKLLDPLVNALFPRRMFWAVLVMLLCLTAQIFRNISVRSKFLGAILSVTFFAVIIFFVPLKITSGKTIELTQQLPQTAPNIDPVVNYRSFMSSPADFEREKFIPEWLKNSEYRLDTQNLLIAHWWSTLSLVPLTRGYTSGFNKVQLSWVYYLQTALKGESREKNSLLLKNQTQFLWDAFGIGYVTPDDYHADIHTDEQLFTKTFGRFRELNKEVTSPIVVSNSSPLILFVGDDAGYETFIRNLAFNNLNSRYVLPIKGPAKIEKLPKDLTNYGALILYRFDGDVSRLETYVKQGGRVFVEGLPLNRKTRQLPSIYPMKQVSESPQSDWQATISQDSPITKNISPDQLSPLSYQGSPWKLWQVKSSDLKPGAEVLLSQNESAILLRFPLGQGIVYWSGMNLLFHIVEYQNFEEARVFGGIIDDLVLSNTLKPKTPHITITRTSPELITITGTETRGVYFKENYHPGWIAWVNGKRIALLPAGLNMMYVPIPIASTPLSMKLEFTGTVFSWGLFLLTIVSGILALFLILWPRLVTSILSNVTKPLRTGWIHHTLKLRETEHDSY